MTFIVAEIGANWRGNIVIVDRMIERCAKAGVDAVKFQALSKSLLARHPEWSWYKDASINEDNVGIIAGLCEDYKVEFLCTPTYLEAVGMLNPYVKAWKIRHADNPRQDIIDRCIVTSKPIYISHDRPPEKPVKSINYIYCIPKYPTDWGEINFDMIKIMPGWSNHCLDPLACLKAIRYGAKYLEFHVSDNKDDFAIDNKVSFSYSQIEEIMRWITKIEKDQV